MTDFIRGGDRCVGLNVQRPTLNAQHSTERLLRGVLRRLRHHFVGGWTLSLAQRHYVARSYSSSGCSAFHLLLTS
jgi:hypothetical protein